MNTTSKWFFLFATSLISVQSYAVCADCTRINGEKVYIQQIGEVLDDYIYVWLKDGRKVEVDQRMLGSLEIALTLGLPFYINQASKDYSIYAK